MLRAIKTFGEGTFICRVYRDAEWDEYRARILRDGRPLTAWDYHTNDKTDAIDTGRSMLARVLGQHVHTVL